MPKEREADELEDMAEVGEDGEAMRQLDEAVCICAWRLCDDVLEEDDSVDEEEEEGQEEDC